MRKVYVNLTVRLIIEAEEGVPINHVIQEMDYEMRSQTVDADIVDTEITDFEITDSK